MGFADWNDMPLDNGCFNANFLDRGANDWFGDVDNINMLFINLSAVWNDLLDVSWYILLAIHWVMYWNFNGNTYWNLNCLTDGHSFADVNIVRHSPIDWCWYVICVVLWNVIFLTRRLNMISISTTV